MYEKNDTSEELHDHDLVSVLTRKDFDLEGRV